MANTHSADFERGSSQYAINTTNGSKGSDYTDFTLEGWMKLESAPASGEFYVIFGEYTADLKATIGYRNDGGTLKVFGYFEPVTTSHTYLMYTVTLNTSQWYHVAFTRNYTTGALALYLDGTSVATSTVGAGELMANGANWISVGESSGNGWYMDGLVNLVRVWNDVRTQPEIEDNMCTVVSSSEAGLEQQWIWNGTDDWTSNVSAGALTLTPTNSPTLNTADVPSCAAASTFVCKFHAIM